jgi:hypothetical protein
MKRLLLELALFTSSPAELDQFVKQQLVAWGKKIKDAGIQPE